MSAPWPRAEPIATPRLDLEPLRVDHAREMAPVLADPALHAFIGGEPGSTSELSARYARQAAGQSPDGDQGWLNWVVRDSATREPLGTVQATLSDTDDGRSAELAWVIATSRQGQGLATEAALAARDCCTTAACTPSPPTSIPTTPRPPPWPAASDSRRRTGGGRTAR